MIFDYGGNLMRNLFSTRVKVVLVIGLLLAAGLAILSGVTNTTPVHLVVQGVLAPFKGAATALTSAAETYYSYMFRYEALAAENEVLQQQIAEMEDVARQADSISRENERLRQLTALQQTHEDYEMVDAYIIGWSSSDWQNTLTINRGTTAGIEEKHGRRHRQR